MLTALRGAGARRGLLAVLAFALGAFPGLSDGAEPEPVLVQGIRAYEAKDYQRARELFGQACKAGYIMGCYNVAVMWDKGEGGPQDKDLAFKLFELTCKAGSAEGCLVVNRWDERTRLEAEHAQLEAEEKRLRKEEKELGQRAGELERALDEAERWLDEAERDAEASQKAYEGGSAYNAGDLERARELYDQACKGGSAEACRELGYMSEQGEGGPQDRVRARELYDRACKDGDLMSCSNLGQMLAKAEGGPPDPGNAAVLFDRACKGGYIRGCYYLGVMSEYQMGGSKGLARARELYDQACRGGVEEACGALSEMARDGQDGDVAPAPYPSAPAPKQPEPQTEIVAKAAVSLEGLYDARGTNPDGSRYAGVCRITQRADGRYRFDWSVGGSYTGTGTLEGNRMTVDWGSDAPVIYQVQADGVLVGTWADGRASETLSPMR